MCNTDSVLGGYCACGPPLHLLVYPVSCAGRCYDRQWWMVFNAGLSSKWWRGWGGVYSTLTFFRLWHGCISVLMLSKKDTVECLVEKGSLKNCIQKSCNDIIINTNMQGKYANWASVNILHWKSWRHHGKGILSSFYLSDLIFSSQCVLQLYGTGLQEFASICLYNVINGWFIIMASKRQTSPA